MAVAATNRHDRLKFPSLFSAVYLASQLANEWGTIALLTLLVFYLTKSGKIPTFKGALVYSAFIFLFLACVATLQFLVGGVYPRLASLLHVSMYAATLALLIEGPRKSDSGIIVIVTCCNGLLLIFFLAGIGLDDLGVSSGDQKRFKSYFTEPARAAAMFALNVYLIHKLKFQGRREVLLVLICLACIFFTYSGTGVVLGGIIATLYLRKHAIKILMPVIVLLSLLWISYDSNVNSQVSRRLEGIKAGEMDNSTFTRFVMPLLFLKEQTTDFDKLLLGFGFGGPERHITQHPDRFEFMVNPFQGAIIPKIANAYVLAIAWFGYPIGIMLICLWVRMTLLSNAPFAFKAFLLAYPVFSGWLLHPFLLLLVCLARDNANQPVVDGPAVRSIAP